MCQGAERFVEFGKIRGHEQGPFTGLLDLGGWGSQDVRRLSWVGVLAWGLFTQTITLVHG